MSKWLVRGLVTVLVSVGLAAGQPAPTQADVKGDLVMVGEKPVAGTYNLKYNNYGERMVTCYHVRQQTPERDVYCDFKGYRVARGEMQVKLHTYRLKERLRKYDYYVLDVDVANADRYGSSKKGWVKVHIQTVGPVNLVDFADTTSVSATQADCASIGLSIGHSVGPVSASMDWGTVRFCDKQATYYVESSTGGHTIYQADHTREISFLSSQRIVKVAKGKKPSFKVTVHVPDDDCTKAKNDKCTKYTNSTYLRSWKIRTTG